jgi:hypothetical protein
VLGEGKMHGKELAVAVGVPGRVALRYPPKYATSQDDLVVFSRISCVDEPVAIGKALVQSHSLQVVESGKLTNPQLHLYPTEAERNVITTFTRLMNSTCSAHIPSSMHDIRPCKSSPM